MTQYSLIFGNTYVFYFPYKRTPNVVMIANLYEHDRNPTVELKQLTSVV